MHHLLRNVKDHNVFLKFVGAHDLAVELEKDVSASIQKRPTKNKGREKPVNRRITRRRKS
jgi:hypothetical protein